MLRLMEVIFTMMILFQCLKQKIIMRMNGQSCLKKLEQNIQMMVTKHSDDFAMWPTKYSDRNAYNMGPHKDLVKEFADAMRNNELKLGLYFTWCFNVYYSHYPSYPVY